MKTAEGYKSIETTRITREEKPNGQTIVGTHVDTMKGVTVEMLIWWFLNFDRMTNWNGQDFSGPARLVYRIWHPRDHICVMQVKPGDDPSLGGCAPGSWLRIQEKLLCKYDLDVVVYTAQLDETTLDLHVRLLGVTLARIEHLWRDGDGGAEMELRMTAGVDIPVVGGLINWLVKRFVLKDEVTNAASQHGTEEFGNLENFLPTLFANPDKLWAFPGAAWK